MRISLVLFLLIAVSCQVKPQVRIMDVGDTSPGYPPPCDPGCIQGNQRIGLELTIDGRDSMSISYSKAAVRNAKLHPAEVIFIQIDANKEDISFMSFDSTDPRKQKFDTRFGKIKDSGDKCILFISGDSIEVTNSANQRILLDTVLRASRRDTTFEPYQEYFGKIKQKLTFRIKSYGMIKLMDTK